jgi:uncharacterized membrane protein
MVHDTMDPPQANVRYLASSSTIAKCLRWGGGGGGGWGGGGGGGGYGKVVLLLRG